MKVNKKLAMLFVSALLIAAMFQYKFHDDPFVTIFSVILLPFYTVLYWRRRLIVLRARCNHRIHNNQQQNDDDAVALSILGRAAFGFGALLSLLFVYGLAHSGVSVPWAIAAWPFAAVCAYCFYKVVIFLPLQFAEADQPQQMLPA
ncbi:hypothetical protein BS78_08G154500 [Paspalum vaginatum]|nr:hypothetical protein BS78_08G154500 [Paspalum vaginatum]